MWSINVIHGTANGCGRFLFAKSKQRQRNQVIPLPSLDSKYLRVELFSCFSVLQLQPAAALFLGSFLAVDFLVTDATIFEFFLVFCGCILFRFLG
jgi:hypothetical protein